VLSHPLNSHILVTGGAGFMGSSFIRYLFEKDGFTGRITNLDLLTYAGNLDNVASVEKDGRYQFIQGDIRKADLLESLEDSPDIIVHFAAETHVDRSIKSPQVFLETNVLGTYHLLEYVRKHPATHFHHISTDEVYGALGLEGVFSESSPYRPNSPYSASKASSDHLVRSYAETYGISTTLSHASNNYGPCQYAEKFIPLMIEHAMQRKPLPVYGRGENRREWLFVEDHSAAIYAILSHGKKGEVYNVGGGNELRNIDLLHKILELMGDASLKSLITYVEDRPGHDFRYAMQGDKIRALGWQPQWSLEEGLKETIRWMHEKSMCYSSKASL
jgi:dTDP-glucose 4,6-dehydratase